MNRSLSRRELLIRGLQVSAGGVTLVAVAACGRGAGSGAASTAKAALCYDPSKVDPSQASMRQQLHYMEMSPNPTTICGGCTYSTFSTPPGMCGTCNIFSGGPVNHHGHCDQWTKRNA